MRKSMAVALMNAARLNERDTHRANVPEVARGYINMRRTIFKILKAKQ